MSTCWNLPVLRLIATDRCRVAAPWFAWTQGRDRAAGLRRRANRLEREKIGATHRLEQWLAALLYLPLTVPRIAVALHRWGRGLRAAGRVPYHRQLVHLAACMWRFGLRPQVYYYLRLHQHPISSDWREVIDPSELHHLQREISPAHLDALEDKLRFTRHGAAHGLPVPPLLAVWCNGRLVAGARTGLRRDLFVRRALGHGSAGVMGFRYNPITGAHHDDARRYSRAELTAKLAEASRDRTLLVNPWLHNHAELAGFSTGALCNYRIVTGRHPGGRTEVILAVLRFPLTSVLTCAEQDTTLCAAVNLATGRLHAAESKLPGQPSWRHHPISGQPIENFAVPRWPALAALACTAHEAWPDFPFIGWDLSDTSTGLVFLEGGCLWGGYLAQMSGCRPLGATPFPRIYQAHLHRRAASTQSWLSLAHV